MRLTDKVVTEMQPDLPPSDDKVIDFYFDFVSPFGYFASLLIDELAERQGFSTRWHSMLIGVSVLKVMGMKPLLDTPLKGPYTVRDAERHARLHGIHLGRRIDAPIVNPKPAGMAFHWVKQHDDLASKAFARAVFSAYWIKGEDISDVAVLGRALGAVNPDAQYGVDELTGAEAAQLLRSAVDASLQRGVFGSPFFIVKGEPFFGVDKLPTLERWLTCGGW